MIQRTPRSDNPPGSEFSGDVEVTRSRRGWNFPNLVLRPGGDLVNYAQFDYDSLGTFISFDVRMEDHPHRAVHPSTFSVYLFRLVRGSNNGYKHNGGTLVLTRDPLGTNAIFSLVGGEGPCGELEVFAPAVFAPPDSILLDLAACRGAEP